MRQYKIRGASGGTGYWPGYASTSNQPFHFTGDFNGDGKTDFMYMDSSWKMLLSTGSGFAGKRIRGTGGAGYWSGYATTSSQSFHFTGDFNGDGKTDFVYMDTPRGGWQFLASNTEAPTLFNSANNGLSMVTGMDHKPLTDSTVYTKETTGVYPVMDMQSPMYVVSSVSSSNGIGGNYLSNYHYFGAKSHLRGGGFLGFRQVEITEPRPAYTAPPTSRTTLTKACH